MLHYSAARSGLAFAVIAGTVAVTSSLAQGVVGRLGPRRVLAAGLLTAAASQALLTRLPVHGSYVSDLLPSFFLIGVGLGVSFISVTIASLAGVPPTHAGVASGLVNVSRQIGGAVGLAAMTTIASLAAHHSTAAPAAVHGDHVAFGVLAALALLAALLTPALRPHRAAAEAPAAAAPERVLEQAA